MNTIFESLPTDSRPPRPYETITKHLIKRQKGYSVKLGTWNGQGGGGGGGNKLRKTIRD